MGGRWKIRDCSLGGLPCLTCVVGGDRLVGELDRVLEELQKEVGKVRRLGRPRWWCVGEPVRFHRDGGRLIWSGLVRRDAEDWPPTPRG